MIVKPLSKWPAIWGILFFSILTGLVLLILFKHISNQKGIATAKSRISAHLLEILLYRNDVKRSFTALLNLLQYNLKYLGYAFKPLLIISPVMFILYIQFSSLYVYRPVQVGEQIIITISCRAAVPLENVQLSENEGFKIKSSPLRLLKEQQIQWKIEALREGISELTFRWNDEKVDKRLVIGQSIVPLAAQRVSVHNLNTILHIAESSLPEKSFLKNVSIAYPRRVFPLFGWRLSWFTWFIVVTLLTGFSFKNILGVNV
jgi:hypothetical protein